MLADLGFEPLVKGIKRRHKVTGHHQGVAQAEQAEASSPIWSLWKVEDCFAQLPLAALSRSYEATAESASTWLHAVCVGYLLSKL